MIKCIYPRGQNLKKSNNTDFLYIVSIKNAIGTIKIGQANYFHNYLCCTMRKTKYFSLLKKESSCFFLKFSRPLIRGFPHHTKVSAIWRNYFSIFVEILYLIFSICFKQKQNWKFSRSTKIEFCVEGTKNKHFFSSSYWNYFRDIAECFLRETRGNHYLNILRHLTFCIYSVLKNVSFKFVVENVNNILHKAWCIFWNVIWYIFKCYLYGEYMKNTISFRIKCVGIIFFALLDLFTFWDSQHVHRVRSQSMLETRAQNRWDVSQEDIYGIFP